MNHDTRAVVDIARQLGFSVEGVTGSGHLMLTHPDGGAVTIPSTPSDYRSRRNVIATLERVSGQRIDRPNHRRSRKKVERSGFSVDVARREQTTWDAAWGDHVDSLRERHDSAVCELRKLAATPTRTCVEKARELVAVIRYTEDRLRALHQPFDPCDLTG